MQDFTFAFLIICIDSLLHLQSNIKDSGSVLRIIMSIYFVSQTLYSILALYFPVMVLKRDVVSKKLELRT